MIDYAALRSIVLDYLKTVSRSEQLGVIEDNHPICQKCAEKGTRIDGKLKEEIQQMFHDLYLERIIITGSGSRSGSGNAAMGWPFYRVTEYGRKVLSTPEYVPHDPEGYLALLKQQIPTLDSIIIRYLEEALGCFRQNFLLAAAVMTGCAAEKALLQLIEAFGDAISDANERAKYEKETQHWMVTRKYEALWKRLEPMSASLPNELGADLHTILDRVRDLIKTARDEAGHPTGKVPDRETVRANLILFPSYCRRIYGLVSHFTAMCGGKKS
jgi:hypothetical protein